VNTNPSELAELQDYRQRSVFRVNQPLPDGDAYLLWEDKAIGRFSTMGAALGVMGVIQEGERWMRLKRRMWRWGVGGIVVVAVGVVWVR